jgi:predicted secreted acid phosphatase
MMRRLGLVLMVCYLVAQGQAPVIQPVVKVAGEPMNLDTVKAKLIKYHDCAKPECYVPQIERQSDRAIEQLKESVAHARAGEKMALVLDIDETSLSNWEEEKEDDFGYVASAWNAWVARQAAPAIAGTLRLYKEAEKDHVAVFFITGRGEGQLQDTAANLKAVGYSEWDGLAMRPANHPKGETTVAYKSGERRKVVARGFTIVMNVGDQLSDLEGDPVAEHSVKLPNPFYFIP